MAVDIKQVSRKILEDVFGKGKLEYLDQVCDPAFKGHDPFSGEIDVAGFKKQAETFRAAFPDLTPTIMGLCAEADTVCTLWRCAGTHQKPFMGVQPTGKKISVDGITFDKFRNGKLVESFAQWDTLRFLQNLGIIPKVELGTPTSSAERRPHA